MTPILLLVIALLLASAGCQTAFLPMANPTQIDQSEYDRVFDAAVAVLREQGFLIDRMDYRFGKVTAKPRASSVLGEFWESDNTTAYQTLESTVNYQRRLVTIRIEPKPQDQPQSQPGGEGAGPSTGPTALPLEPPKRKYFLAVQVLVQQLEDPNHYLTGSYLSPWADLNATPAELQDRGINGAYWRATGRDPYLEQRLIADILRRSITIDLPTTEPSAGS